MDVAHKKRGRPRLRNDRRQKTVPPTRSTQSEPRHMDSAIATRELRPTAQEQNASLLPSQPYLRRLSSGLSNENVDGMPFAGPRSDAVHSAVAFLDTDLNIVKTNDQLRALFPGMYLNGEKLISIVDGSAWRTLEYLHRQLKEECHSKDNLHHTRTIWEEEVRRSIPDIDDTDLDRATATYINRTQPINFRLLSGQIQTLTVSLRLAKTESYFVILQVVSNNSRDEAYQGGNAAYYSPQTAFADTAHPSHVRYSTGYSLTAGPAPHSFDTHNPGFQSIFHGMQSVTPPTGLSDNHDGTFRFMTNQAQPRSSSPPVYYHGPTISSLSRSTSAPAVADSWAQPYYFGQDLGGQQPHGYNVEQLQDHMWHPSIAQVRQMQMPRFSTHGQETMHGRRFDQSAAPDGMNLSLATSQWPNESSLYGESDGDYGVERSKRRRLDDPSRVL